ncbi:hypothetical protein GCM10009801_75100 [Streptomyces albiaxialis]|uniref:Chaplin domain-containing protein n=1 Tax=Streptomyces albiaxialis TaxID=329523 RepID=A0ABN2WYN5_9ACTN
MRIRTGIAAAVAASALVLSAGSAAVAADGPENFVKHRPVTVTDDGPTGIGLNVLCGIGLLGKGVCSN